MFNNAIKYQFFIESSVMVLSDEQITEYIANYLTISQDNPDEETAKDYEEYINKIPALKNLIRTPFLLMVAMEVMPRIIKQSDESKPITKARLLDEFIEQLFENEEDKLMVEGNLPTDGSDVKEDFWAFAMELAVAMHEAELTSVYYSSQHSSSSDTNVRNKFFGIPDSQQAERLIRARNGCRCILKITNDDCYSFIHPILQDYFVVKKILLDERKMLKTKNTSYKQADLSHRLRL